MKIEETANANVCAIDGGFHWLEMKSSAQDGLVQENTTMILCSDGKRLWVKEKSKVMNE